MKDKSYDSIGAFPKRGARVGLFAAIFFHSEKGFPLLSLTQKNSRPHRIENTEN